MSNTRSISKAQSEQALEIVNTIVFQHAPKHLEALQDAITQCFALMLESKNPDLFAEISDILLVHYQDIQQLKEWRDQQPLRHNVLIELGKKQVDLEVLNEFFEEGLNEWFKSNRKPHELEHIKAAHYLCGGNRKGA
ncbi:MAG: hypothetical protein ACK5QX_11840 [bacterium]